MTSTRPQRATVAGAVLIAAGLGCSISFQSIFFPMPAGCVEAVQHVQGCCPGAEISFSCSLSSSAIGPVRDAFNQKVATLRCLAPLECPAVVASGACQDLAAAQCPPLLDDGGLPDATASDPPDATASNPPDEAAPLLDGSLPDAGACGEPPDGSADGFLCDGGGAAD